MTIVEREERAVWCPSCGYDLRAAEVGEGGARRCPECGKVSQGMRSRIPWEHRGYLGSVTAFCRTVWMVLVRPGALVAEMGSRVGRRDAEGFHRLAMLLGTGGLGGVVALAWGFYPSVPIIASDWAAGPVVVLSDSLWGLVPLFISVYVSLRISMGLYRGFLLEGSRRGFERRRMARVALYASGAGVIWVWVLGLLGGALWILQGDIVWVDYGRWWIKAGCVVLGIGCALSYLWTSVGLALRRGQWRAWRVVSLVAVFPAVAMLVFLFVGTFVFWIAGYAAIAIWSMTR